MNFTKFGLWILVLFQTSQYVFGQFNMTTYRLMPPLYEYDDYDACLEKEQAAYCVVHIEIKPDESNPIWREISNFSADSKRHYNHEYLQYGVCTDRCTMKQQSEDWEQILPSSFRYKEVIEHYELVYSSPTMLNDRRKFSSILKACLNDQFQKKYNLSVEIFIMACDKSEKITGSKPQPDPLKSTTYNFFYGIMALVVFSSLCDLWLKKQQPESLSSVEFYKLKHSSRLHELLTAFSVCRNYYKLIMPPKHELQQELRFLDGFKAIAMFFVVLSHCQLVLTSTPTKNPESLEKAYHGKIAGVVFFGMVLMQGFFCMSSFLLFANFTSRKIITDKTSVKNAIKIWIMMIAYRYLRLMLSVVPVVLFTATLFSDFVSGPFAKTAVTPEAVFCRRNWWLIFGAMNNNNSIKESCLHQTWFISTDLHLFILFSLILTVVSMYPKLKSSVYSTLIILSSGIPILVTYIHQIHSFLSSSPDFYRHSYFRNFPNYYELYFPYYTNLGGYVYGFIAAEIYMKLRHRQASQSNSKRTAIATKILKNRTALNLLWWLLFIGLFSLLGTGIYFMENDFESDLLINSLHVLTNTIWIIFAAALVLGMALKIGWIGYDFFCLPNLQILGRVSYQMLIWHTVVLRWAYTALYNMPYVSFATLTLLNCSVYVVSLMVAFAAAIVFEYPCQIIVNHLFTFLMGASKPKSE